MFVAPRRGRRTAALRTGAWRPALAFLVVACVGVVLLIRSSVSDVPSVAGADARATATVVATEPVPYTSEWLPWPEELVPLTVSIEPTTVTDGQPFQVSATCRQPVSGLQVGMGPGGRHGGGPFIVAAEPGSSVTVTYQPDAEVGGGYHVGPGVWEIEVQCGSFDNCDIAGCIPFYFPDEMVRQLTILPMGSEVTPSVPGDTIPVVR